MLPREILCYPGSVHVEWILLQLLQLTLDGSLPRSDRLTLCDGASRSFVLGRSARPSVLCTKAIKYIDHHHHSPGSIEWLENSSFNEEGGEERGEKHLRHRHFLIFFSWTSGGTDQAGP
jgi:hypothetical protein